MSTAHAREAETVVLLHGLWFSGWTLGLLARRLRARGYRTRSFSYRSVSRGLAENAAELDAFAHSSPAPVVHFVGHSLGGVVIRALFHAHPRQPPGRIVTLGSPHGGSYPAAVLSRSELGRRIVGRSIGELLAGLPARWTHPERDFGVLAGVCSLGVGRLVPGLPRPNDGVVPLVEARLPGATDAVELPVSHTALLVSNAVARQVAHFLEHGRFDHAAARTSSPADPGSGL